MEVVVRPRLQKETWSLYWKESTNTETVCLQDIRLQLEAGSTIQDLLAAVAAELRWQDAATLTKLEGFKGPWERAISRGRELPPGTQLDPELVQRGPVVVVRTQLLAEGWKIEDEYDLSSSEDEE